MSASGPHAAIRKHSVDLPIGLSHRPRDESVVSSLHCMNDPQPEGHMTSHIERREFSAALGGTAVAWPLAARAQQPERMRRIGVLMSYVESDTEAQQQAKAFSQSLAALGWTESSNITLDYRWRGPPPGQLQTPAVELLALADEVIE